MWLISQIAAVRSLFLIADILVCPIRSSALALGVSPRPALRDLSTEHFGTYVGRDYGRDLAVGQDVPAIVKWVRFTTTGTVGEYNVNLDCSQQFLPSGVTIEAIERFFRSIMVKTASYPDHDGPESPAFTLSVGALALGVRCLRRILGDCVPWPLVSAFAEFMMRRAQRGLTGRMFGHIYGANGIVVQVTFNVAVAAGQAVAQSILDSALDHHGHFSPQT